MAEEAFFEAIALVVLQLRCLIATLPLDCDPETVKYLKDAITYLGGRIATILETVSSLAPHYPDREILYEAILSLALVAGRNFVSEIKCLLKAMKPGPVEIIKFSLNAALKCEAEVQKAIEEIGRISSSGNVVYPGHFVGIKSLVSWASQGQVLGSVAIQAVTTEVVKRGALEE